MCAAPPSSWSPATGCRHPATPPGASSIPLWNRRSTTPNSANTRPASSTGILARRGELLSDCLTIWRWGRQQSNLKRGLPFGTYERWTAWVRDPLLALGCDDPVKGVQDARDRDPHRVNITALFAEWRVWHGRRLGESRRPGLPRAPADRRQGTRAGDPAEAGPTGQHPARRLHAGEPGSRATPPTGRRSTASSRSHQSSEGLGGFGGLGAFWVNCYCYAHALHRWFRAHVAET